jgi:protein-tyrosine phosphatase
LSEPLKLDGIDNFRDFGGFVTGSGAVAHRGRLLRSACPDKATDSDLAILAAAPVRLVVDLRRRTERRLAPSRLGESLDAQVIESDEGDLGESPHAEFLRHGEVSPQSVEAYLINYYENAFFEPRHRSLFSRTFQALETLEGAVLIHCAAGKDRTGLLVALMRQALGGHWEETLADFELTNRFTLTPDKLAQAEMSVGALLGRPPGGTVLQAFLGVWPRHLEAAFAAVVARVGSIDAYLASLGVDMAQRARLIERFTG